MKGKDGKKDSVKKKPKKGVQISKVTVYVKSTYNNTVVSIADLDGNILAWSSPGVIGYAGSRKSTAYAATKAAEDAVEKAAKYGIKEAQVIVKGAGMGRQAAVKGIRSAGLKISQLSDHTAVPHGGVRPRKLPRK